MCRRILLVVLACGVAASSLFAADDAPRLIEQMKSNRFAERQQAYKKLQAIGEPALKPLLNAAVNHPDAEVRKLSAKLATEIAQRVDADRMMTPKRMHLVYQDVPLAQAISDFKKKSGRDFILKDPDKKLASRRVTLDTGEATFWEALDQFCAKAGLAPVNLHGDDRQLGLYLVAGPGGQIKLGQQPQKKPNPAPGPGNQQKPAPQPKQPDPDEANNPSPGDKSSDPITLENGREPSLPTHYAGSFRVRAVPQVKKDVVRGASVVVVWGNRGGPGGNQPAKAGLVGLTLELAVQPGIGISSISRVRVEHAVDDHGQRLQPLKDLVNERGPLTSEELGNLRIFQGLFGGGKIVDFDRFRDDRCRTVPVELAKGGKPPKALKEISGVVSATVLAPYEERVRVSNVFGAAGRRVEKKLENAIKVLEAKQDAAGKIRLRLEFTLPEQLAPDAPKETSQVVLPYLEGPLGRLSLEDATGRLSPESLEVQRIDGSGANQWEVRASFRAPNGRKPEALIFEVRKFVTVNVPFALKNVPLNKESVP